VPRGKIAFDVAHSPRVRNFRSDPEGAVRQVMARHGATYIDDSLVFATGGGVAHALFKTVEAEGGGSETDLLGIGKELDAIEICVFIDPARWQEEFGGDDDDDES
jgi:hypothetical protein